MAQGNSRNNKTRSDNQVISLLNQLGDRMIRGEQEQALVRRRYDSFIDELDRRTARAEKAEAVLRERQEKLETQYSEQIEKIEKAVALADRIEEAIAQQQRLNRRLEKVTQDKIQMIRKLERIEETVIETQEALSQHALIPADAPGALHASGRKNNKSGEDIKNWWHGPLQIQIAGVAAMIALAVIGGWALSRMQIAGMPQLSIPGQHQQQVIASAAPSSATPQSRFVSGIEDEIGMAETVQEIPLPESTAAISAVTEDEMPAQPAPFTMDSEELLAAYEADPDALAAQLNEITPTAAPIPEKLDAPPPVMEEKTKKEEEKIIPAAATQQAAKPIEKKGAAKEKDIVTAFLKTQSDSKALSLRIKPDDSLPSVITEVEKKAFEGVAEAQHDLAAIYTAGHGGVAIDYERAAQWFKEAAMNGVANARYNLGVLYHQGLGVEKSIDLAINWYRAAADKGHPEAQYNLGIAYIEGVGAPYDPERAAHYFENAARGGILEAAYNLGLVFENGLINGKPQPDMAFYWYDKAADLGSPEARAAINQLAKALNMSDEAVKSAIRAIKVKEEAAEGTAKPTTKKASFERTAAPQEQQALIPLPQESGLTASDMQEPPKKLELAAPVPSAADQNPALVAQIQEQLVRFGLFPGPADGAINPVTEDAIRSYQTLNDLERSGKPSQALLVHMLTNDMTIETGSRN